MRYATFGIKIRSKSNSQNVIEILVVSEKKMSSSGVAYFLCGSIVANCCYNLGRNWCFGFLNSEFDVLPALVPNFYLMVGEKVFLLYWSIGYQIPLPHHFEVNMIYRFLCLYSQVCLELIDVGFLVTPSVTSSYHFF